MTETQNPVVELIFTGRNCPSCGSEAIDLGEYGAENRQSLPGDTPRASSDFCCYGCGAVWDASYVLERVILIELDAPDEGPDGPVHDGVHVKIGDHINK